METTRGQVGSSIECTSEDVEHGQTNLDARTNNSASPWLELSSDVYIKSSSVRQ